jgi:hypothetical protein
MAEVVATAVTEFGELLLEKLRSGTDRRALWREAMKEDENARFGPLADRRFTRLRRPLPLR